MSLLNSTLNGAAFTPVNNPYISLHTADPTDAGTGTEVTGGSYARVASSFPTASGTTGLVASNADAVFINWWQYDLSYGFGRTENN